MVPDTEQEYKSMLTLPSFRLQLCHTTFAPTYTPLALLHPFIFCPEKVLYKVFPHISEQEKKILHKTNPANASSGILIIMALNNIHSSLKSYQNTRTWSYLPNTDILIFQNNDQRPSSHHSSDSIL